MREVRSELDWEIEQMNLAVIHYEKAIRDCFSSQEEREYIEVVHSLNSKIKELECERDDSGF